MILLAFSLSFFFNFLLVRLTLVRIEWIAIHRVDWLTFRLIIKTRLIPWNTRHMMRISLIIVGTTLTRNKIVIHGLWDTSRMIANWLSITIHIYLRDSIRSCWGRSILLETCWSQFLVNHRSWLNSIIHIWMSHVLLLSYWWEFHFLYLRLSTDLLLNWSSRSDLLWLHRHHLDHLLHHLFLRQRKSGFKDIFLNAKELISIKFLKVVKVILFVF